MLLRTLPTLLLAATAVQALKDASPFLMLSSEPLQHNELESKQLATAQTVEEQLTNTLSSCSEGLYLLVSQPGLKASDFQDATSMPRMRRRIANGKSGTVVEIANVVGNVDLTGISNKCNPRMYAEPEEDAWKKTNTPMTLPILPNDFSEAVTPSDRAAVLEHTDIYIDAHLSRLENDGQPYVFIFTSSSSPPAKVNEDKHYPYEMDEPYPSALHTDLKRDFKHNMQRRQSNSTNNAQAGLPLFEKYQFLTPALFMGLSVSLLLFIILYVGVSAIAGLEVSYAAFSKEMGPQAQKKQQ